MKERFFLMGCKTLQSQKGLFYTVSVYDNNYDCIVKVFVDRANYDYFKDCDVLTDISHLITFLYDNKSGQYRLSILRKE